MPSLATPDLDALRQKIAALEKRPALAEGAALLAQQVGQIAAANDTRPDLHDLLAAPPGVLHEVFADEQQQSTLALGFALGMARRLIGERKAVLYLQLAEKTQELGLPYAIGVQQFGIDPDMMIIGRVGDVTELLWAMEEAISCRAVAGVIADVIGNPRALDFTASRRLSLRASATGTSAFILRYGLGREASASKLRWHVSPAVSAEQFYDPLAPGPPRFVVEIEKKRLGSKMQRAEGMRLTLDWTEDGFISAEPKRRIGLQPRKAAPAPRAVTCRAGRPIVSSELIRLGALTGPSLSGRSRRARCGSSQSTPRPRPRPHAGQHLSDARALVPELDVREIDRAALEHRFADFADWHSNASPIVAVLTDQAAYGDLCLDITGVEHLFGGEDGNAGKADRTGSQRSALPSAAPLPSASAPPGRWRISRLAEIIGDDRRRRSPTCRSLRLRLDDAQIAGSTRWG